jgi:hypothetical protein
MNSDNSRNGYSLPATGVGGDTRQIELEVGDHFTGRRGLWELLGGARIWPSSLSRLAAQLTEGAAGSVQPRDEAVAG